MKKLIAAIAALVMMALGLVAASGNVTAQAGYEPDSVPTQCKVASPHVKQGKRAKTTVNVTSNSDVQETGKVTITWSKRGGGFSKSKTYSYSGKKTYTGPVMNKRGEYNSKVKFNPAPQSIHKVCGGHDGFRVTR